VSLYDDWAPFYDDWAAPMTEDVPFYVDLAREADGPVVELAVGTGRIAIPTAKATSRRVIGVDASPAMLAVARERAAAAGVELDLRLGDMRELELEEPAALITCPFRSLLHLPSWHDRRRVFERVAACLRPGGRFAWNAFVFDPRIAVEIDGVWRVQNGVEHRCDYVPADTRVDITLASGGKTSLWWISRTECEGLFEVAGLEVDALYGWFDRRPFDESSREMVWVSRRPA
jgi:SAM-dependent methyltransferase